MRKTIPVTIILFTILISAKLIYQKLNFTGVNNVPSSSQINFFRTNTPKPVTPVFSSPGSFALLANPTHAFQTFNNCGPATLSMALGFWGKQVSQAELGQKMRPYQNPRGDNDDKTIFSEEFIYWTGQYDMQGINRVNGDIELLKTFTANGIPVVVKTWLNPGEDIGHFRLIRGFDETRGVIIQDDSYQGKDLEISYERFLAMWQPFNYDYSVIFPDDKREMVEAIIGEEMDEEVAWRNALWRAETEMQDDTSNIYAIFNSSTANYHLGNHIEAVNAYEKVRNLLPKRMLWYQIEPIQAYFKAGQPQKALTLIDLILTNHNRAFSELYVLKGEWYLSQGDTSLAKEMFELAVFYNSNYLVPQNYLKTL